MDKLRSIAIFQEVVRRGSFSAAAASLELVNSAVSRQVSELEKWLGVKLLYRTTRSLSLTDQGKTYLAKFESLLAGVDELEQLANINRDEVTGTLKITTFPYLGQYLLNPLLSDFLTRYPRVRLSLMITDQFVSLIDEGLDLAIRASVLSDSNLVARKIGTVTIRAVATEKYLFENGVPQIPEDLQKHNCLYDSVLDRHNRRWQFSNAEREVSVPVDGNLIANSGAMCRDMAIEGIGIAYLPNFMVDQPIADGRLVEVLPDYKGIDFPLSIVYPQNRQMSLALRTFIDNLVEVLEQKKLFHSS
jgi:LysR family transcriptional regulator for bpeEF and oprC